ncbi:MAG: hypothetical protein Q9212_006904 [Teloschistes hypoglaucus]
MTYPGSHSYTFATERLLARPLRPDDADVIFALKSDPQVLFWTALIQTSTPVKEFSEAEAWVEERLGSDIYLSFCLQELSGSQHDGVTNGKKPHVIGICGATHLPEVGYMFRPSAWGKGYATEALQGFIEFYWETFPQGHPSISDADERTYLKAVTGPPEEAPQSAASIRVLKKCGFEYWKEQKEDDSVHPGVVVMLPVWRLWGPNQQANLRLGGSEPPDIDG